MLISWYCFQLLTSWYDKMESPCDPLTFCKTINLLGRPTQFFVNIISSNQNHNDWWDVETQKSPLNAHIRYKIENYKAKSQHK